MLRFSYLKTLHGEAEGGFFEFNVVVYVLSIFHVQGSFLGDVGRYFRWFFIH